MRTCKRYGRECVVWITTAADAESLRFMQWRGSVIDVIRFDCPYAYLVTPPRVGDCGQRPLRVVCVLNVRPTGSVYRENAVEIVVGDIQRPSDRID